jgi:diguanylate cyclase (GGDEF)-like protein
LFRDYVATDAEIDAVTLDYLGAVHQVEHQLEQVRSHAGEAVATTRDTLNRLRRTTILTVLGVGLIAILLGLLVAAFIVRNANRSVAACVDFAGRLASGDWNARLPASGGRNEFAVLAAAQNRMAEAMQATHRRDDVRAAELWRLNRTLRMLSRCNEALVRASSESELLNAICQQIVDSGDYRLAWVGFACHDEDKSVQLAAFAGVGGNYLADLKLSWGDDERRREIGGRAICEGWPVIVRDIATDPVFEPWRQQAIKLGFASCMAHPLKGKDGVLGTLNIYSADDDAFDAEEVQLLQELAEDLAFGIVSQRETARRMEAERALDYQTNFDTVTGLANRNLFSDRLRQAIAHAGRAGRQVAILQLSLDRYKAVKDSLGHGAGDALLQHVGRSLTSTLREGDTVARLSGDEFAVAIGDLASEADVAPVVLKLLAAVLEPMTLAGSNVYTSASIGISLYPKDGAETNQLLHSADAALSSAKAMGGNLFRFYAAEMNERISTRFAMESELRRALAQDELRVYFQPRVNLASGEMCGAEALVRWQHPAKGLVPPSDFIPLAEETGLILPLGEWVIRSVCRQQRSWLDAGLPVPPVAVNLSALQFRQENLAQLIRHELAANQLEASYLEMEITESTLMDNLDQAVATLQQLRATGIKLSLDDFGTGHSSLSRLRRLPIDHLKIDQSFVRNLTTDPEDAAICLSIIGLAHNLHMTVIAEGVETEGQANYLRQHRCDEMQGYYFSRPLPVGDFEQLLAQRRTLALPTQAGDQRRTLLLVDDEANILAALKRALRQEGYKILSAGSAREGLDLLATHSVQVIVSDQRMPEMNGTEFLSRVRDLYPNTVRLVLSGYTDLGSVTNAINRGAIYKFLTKPWDEAALRTDLREAFQHHESAPIRC